MRIDAEQLSSHLARSFGPLYSIVGEEALLALEAVDRLRTHARDAGYAERMLLVVESGFDWSSLGAAGASLSLFAQQRLLELKIPTGKPGSAGAQAIERYCAALPPDTVTLISLPAIDWKAMQAGWFEALESAGVIVEARSVDRNRLPRWLALRLGAQNQSADEHTLQFIAARVEGNLLAAWQEVQKLGLLFPAGKLDHDAVRRAVLDVARFDVGDVSDALLADNAAQYVRVLDGLQAEGAALPLILWSIANDLRSAILLKHALDRGVPIANALREARIFGPRRSTMERAARRWPAASLERALASAAQIDRMVKGIAHGRPWDELRELGLQVIGATPRRGVARPV